MLHAWWMEKTAKHGCVMNQGSSWLIAKPMACELAKKRTVFAFRPTIFPSAAHVFSGNYCSSQALVCFQWFCCNVMSETHDKHCVLILIHVSMAKDNFLWGGIRRYHLKWVAAHLLRPRAPYAEMRHLRGMRQCFGGAYTTQPATWFVKKTCLSQLKKRSQAPSPGSLTKGRFWQPAMLLDVTSGMSHTFHIINTSWKLDAREVKTELLSDVRRPLGPLDLPTAPSIHHDDPPSTPPSRCRHKIRVPIKQDFW